MIYLGTNPRAKVDLLQLLTNPPQVVGCDTETVSVEDKTLQGFCIALNLEDVFWWEPNDEQLDYALRILRSPQITKVWHNAKFDHEVMEGYGIDTTNFEDSMVMAYNLNLPMALYDLYEQLIGAVPEYARGYDFDNPDAEGLRAKCGFDARAAVHCYGMLKDKVPASYYLDRNIIELLRAMEKRGLAIDQEEVQRLEQLNNPAGIKQLIVDTTKVNPASPLQVGLELCRRGWRLPLSKGGKQYKSSRDLIKGLPDSFAQAVLQYRDKAKLHSTYIKPMLGVDRVFPKFNNTVAVTGRLSSSGPNIQNQPEAIRSIFKADEYFVDMDASQIELRVVAWLAQDHRMLKAFYEGDNIHKATMRELGLNNYKVAKVINFAVVYGGAEDTIISTAADAGVYLTMEEAIDFRLRYFSRFTGVAEWIDATIESIRANKQVTTMYGRVRKAEGRLTPKALRELINMPVQGTAADIIKKAMGNVGLSYDLRAAVHDELLFDGCLPPLSLFDGIAPFNVPMEVKMGTSWGNVEKVEYRR